MGLKPRKQHNLPVSSRNPEALGSSAELEHVCISLAGLEAIACPEWEYRTYSFNPTWGDGERMASSRNGSGDDYFIVFSDAGAYVQGFDHESNMSPYRVTPEQPWPGLFDKLPESMWRYRDEPAFGPKNCTFCLWRTHDSAHWERGVLEFPDRPGSGRRSAYNKSTDDPDGSQWLLEIFDDPLPRFLRHCTEVHERTFPVELAEAVFGRQPLSSALIDSLCGEDSSAVKKELAELGL